MTIIESLILGIIEGITEFLPISSTGHLILTTKILDIPQSDFVKSFEIIIQLGAILAVVFLYRKKIWPFDFKLWSRVFVSFIPTAIIGFVLYKLIKSVLLGNAWITAASLIIGGMLLIYFEKRKRKKDEQLEAMDAEVDASELMAGITYKTAFIIGVFQSLAVIPGVSRSAATIIGGQLLGLGRKSIVEYSFLLAIPTMFAASGYDFLKNSSAFSGGNFTLLAIGFVTSFIVALLSVKFLLIYIKKNDFTYFGIYRIIIGILFIILLQMSII
jgi:undecaprenyl-diphosphatase